MEGVGSRLSRASSRYIPTTTVFNGPVRKWKKKWVHVSSSSTTHQNSKSHSKNAHNNASRILLCRWTPISSPTSTGDGDNVAEEQPRRKFRYTPIVVLEKQKKEVAEKADNEVETAETYQETAMPGSDNDGLPGKPDIIEVSMKEAQASNQGLVATKNSHVSHLDLELFTGNSDHHKSASQNREASVG